jgi:hypothetical protein
VGQALEGDTLMWQGCALSLSIDWLLSQRHTFSVMPCNPLSY